MDLYSHFHVHLHSWEGLSGDRMKSASFSFQLTLITNFASFQSLQKLFTTREWKLDKTDKRQTKCIVSLQLALPQKALCLLTVNMKRFLEWLSTPEGPDLIDSHSDPPTMPYMALAVGLDPDHLYRNPKGVVAGIGLVYKPSYINTMPFADAYDIIGDYLEGSSKSLARPCLLFLSISDKSAIFPYVGDNPLYVDLASKEKSETHPTGGKLGDFRSFLLPRVMARPNRNSTEYSCCTGYPRHPGGRPILINPIAPLTEKRRFSQGGVVFSHDTRFSRPLDLP